MKNEVCIFDQAPRCGSRQQNGIFVDRRAAYNESRGGFQRIVLDDAADSPWPQHTAHLFGENEAGFRENVVINPYGGHEVEGRVVERDPGWVVLRPGKDATC